MSQVWRRKKHYKTRVLIDTDRVLNPTFDDSLLCITGSQLEMLRNLTQYLRRRSTFVSEYEEGSYLAPTNEEWDELQAIVSDLEEVLMGCEDIVSQLACICSALKQLRTSDAIPADSALPDQTAYDTYRSPVVEDEGAPPTGWETWPEWKVAKCKGAQKVIDDIIVWMDKLITWSGAGTVLTFVVLESALVATTIIPPLAIVMAIASLIAIVGLSLIQQAAQDWIAEHKQCLVCAIFEADTAELARLELETYIAAEWDIAGSPSVFLHLLNYATLSRIFDGTLPDYEDWQAEYSAAYCAICGDVILGNNWWALPLDPEFNTITIESAACWQGVVPAGQTMCGLIWKVQNMSGDDLLLKCMSNHEAGCYGCSTFPNTSDHKTEGIYFTYRIFKFDNADCKSELCPTATDMVTDNCWCVGPQDQGAGFHFFGTNKYVEIVFMYQVFMGIEPPCQ